MANKFKIPWNIYRVIYEEKEAIATYCLKMP